MFVLASYRKQSIAKLHTKTVEAPITRVVNLLTSAQENAPVLLAQALENVSQTNKNIVIH